MGQKISRASQVQHSGLPIIINYSKPLNILNARFERYILDHYGNSLCYIGGTVSTRFSSLQIILKMFKLTGQIWLNLM